MTGYYLNTVYCKSKICQVSQKFYILYFHLQNCVPSVTAFLISIVVILQVGDVLRSMESLEPYELRRIHWEGVLTLLF